MFTSVVYSLSLVVSIIAAQAEQSRDLSSVLQNAQMSSTGEEAGQVQGQTRSQTIHKLGFKKMDVVHKVNGEQVETPHKTMELYNQMNAGDVAVVERDTAEARCVPNIVPSAGGQVNGFRCMQIMRDSALDKAGVVDGDLVMSIDGQRPTSPTDLLSKIASRQYSHIVVMRNGQEIVLR